MNGIPFPGSPACFSPIDMPPFNGRPFGALTSSVASSSVAVDIGPFNGRGAEGKPFFMAEAPSPPKLFFVRGGNGSPFFRPVISPSPLIVCFAESDISILAFLASSASSAVMPSVICVGASSAFSSGFTPVCSLLVLILSASSAVTPS